MFEDSVESFIVRWRPFATGVRLHARGEGSPLLECSVAGTVLQVLERTNPYAAQPGRAHMILNFTAERLTPTDARAKRIEATGVSRAHVEGLVVLREDDMVVVDAGAPIVVGVLEPLPDDLAPGDFVTFDGVPPIHGFVVERAADDARERQPEDELM